MKLLKIIWFIGFCLSSCFLYGQGKDSLFVLSIEIEGNKRTKTVFIEELIPLSANKYYSKTKYDSLLTESVNRLNRSELFKTVEIVGDTSKITSNTKGINVKVKLTERWYFWPYPVIELADPNLNIWLQDKDFTRVRYGIAGRLDNLSGVGDKVVFRLITGFSKEARLSYISFPRKQWSLSYGVSYVQSPQLEVNNNAAVRQFERLSPEILKERYGAGIAANKQLNAREIIGMSLNISQSKARDSLLIFNDAYYGASGRSSLALAEFSFLYANDSRSNIAFPFNGRLFALRASTPFYKNEKPILLASADYRKYFDFETAVASFQLQGQVSLSENKALPFEYLESNRLLRVPRIFDLYVPNAVTWIQQRNQLLFLLYRNKVVKTSFIPFEQFNNPYFTLAFGPFVDQVYFYNTRESGGVYNKWLQSAGVSLQLATYYDKVYRIDVGYNSLGDFGVFLQFRKAL